MVARPKTREERLFSAAVLRRTFELNGGEQGAQFETIYLGVLRDLGCTDEEVTAFLAEHRAEVEAALGRRG